MVRQYPYKLEVLEITEGTYNEQTGTWTEEKQEWVTHSSCRDQVASSGSRIATTDGEMYEYKWIVFMPKGVEEIEPGIIVRVTNGSEVRLEARAVRFSSEQLHCRLWL